MDIVFEALLEKDLEAIRNIYNYYVENSTATFALTPLSREEMKQNVFFSQACHQTFIIKSQDPATAGKICGYVLTAPYKERCGYAKTAEISVYLAPEYVGAGLGRQAVAFMESFAKEQGIHTLISVICADNVASVLLFQKCGYNSCAHFKEVGIKFDRWLDVVCYQKIL